MQAQRRSRARTWNSWSRTGESSSVAQLDGSDIVYVAGHAAETPIEVLTGEYLPLLLRTAGAISADWAACQAAPQVVKAEDGRVSAERAG
jgi:hypothetical protein